MISWEEATYFIKMPRLRKDNVKTNIKDFNHENDNAVGNFDDIDYFFDEDYNNRYNDKLLNLEYEEHHIKRKRRIQCCLLLFTVLMSVIIIAGCITMYFNFYGITDYMWNIFGIVNSYMSGIFNDKPH